LTKSSLQQSSIPTYTRAWKLFAQFHIAIFQTARFSMPISPATLALFIAYLFDHNYAFSTVNTYVSAIGYSHKLSSLPDPTRVFYIIQMLKVYARNGICLDSCLLVTFPILQSLLAAAPGITALCYQVCQFKAMCSLAFFAFLRIGKITKQTNNASCQPLQNLQSNFICLQL
jgi:hypothetical protein